MLRHVYLRRSYSANILSYAHKAYLNRIQADEKQVPTFKKVCWPCEWSQWIKSSRWHSIKDKFATAVLTARKGVKEHVAPPGCAQPYFWCCRWQLECLQVFCLVCSKGIFSPCCFQGDILDPVSLWRDASHLNHFKNTSSFQVTNLAKEGEEQTLSQTP